MTIQFPKTRLRRPRLAKWSRQLLQESAVRPMDLVWPVFVQEGKGVATPVDSMPGVFRHTMATIAEAVAEAKQAGICAVALFPVVPPERKSEQAEESFRADNLMCRAIAEITGQVEDMGVIADVALDPYTTHGQDGVIRDGRVDNDDTVAILCKQAVVQAQAGASIIAPSDMMDGRVGSIRNALDAAGYQDVMIMSYAAKYASAFYGPFREAVGSKKSLASNEEAHSGNGNNNSVVGKHTYQMDPANGDEALVEVAMDLSEGADMFIVKPGMPYLDVVWRTKQQFGRPTFVYQVSGEYAMMRAAAQNGWLEWEDVLLESLACCKRAGADGILTYVRGSSKVACWEVGINAGSEAE